MLLNLLLIWGTCLCTFVTSQVDLVANAENMLTGLMSRGPVMTGMGPETVLMTGAGPAVATGRKGFMLDCRGIECSSPVCPPGVQPVLLEGQCCLGCPAPVLQTGGFTKTDLQRMLRLMREEGQVFNLQGQPAGFGEPILSEARLLEFLQDLESMSGMTSGSAGSVSSGTVSSTVGGSGGEASNMVDINLFPSGTGIDPVAGTTVIRTVADSGTAATGGSMTVDSGSGPSLIISSVPGEPRTITEVTSDTSAQPIDTAMNSNVEAVIQPETNFITGDTGVARTETVITRETAVDPIVAGGAGSAEIIGSADNVGSMNVVTVERTGEGSMIDPATAVVTGNAETIISQPVETVVVPDTGSAPVEIPVGFETVNTGGAFEQPGAVILNADTASVDPVTTVVNTDTLGNVVRETTVVEQPVATVVTGETGILAGQPEAAVVAAVEQPSSGPVVGQPSVTLVDQPAVILEAADTSINQPGATILTSGSEAVVDQPAIVTGEMGTSAVLTADAGAVVDQPGAAVVTSVENPVVNVETVNTRTETVSTPELGNVAVQPSGTVDTVGTETVLVEQPVPTVVITNPDIAVQPVETVVTADAGRTAEIRTVTTVTGGETVIMDNVPAPSVVATNVDTVPAEPMMTVVTSEGSGTVVDPATAVVTGDSQGTRVVTAEAEPPTRTLVLEPAPIVDGNTVVLETSPVVDPTGIVDSQTSGDVASQGSAVSPVDTGVSSGMETVAVVSEPASPVEVPVTVEAGPSLVVADPIVSTSSETRAGSLTVETAPVVDRTVDTAPAPAINIIANAPGTVVREERIVTVDRTGPATGSATVAGSAGGDPSRMVIIESPASVQTGSTSIGVPATGSETQQTTIITTGPRVKTVSTGGSGATTVIRPTGQRTAGTGTTFITNVASAGRRGVIDDTTLLTAPFSTNVSLDFGREWLKARVDSAPCARYNCNLPICYVPHDTDCKSYIVCQRTALGTYVAWKMRCAFGSFWGSGKMWTCERVEDLAGKGYTCPNDPCRNSNTLFTYPDEDEKNCRTYWRCENGISKPACCPPGQMFDSTTLKCENDPMETCRSPCPLKIEGCSLPGARTQPFYDGNCRTYWDCENGHPHPVCCPAGMSYNSETGTCLPDEFCKADCPPEYTGKVCGKVAGESVVTSYALADGNCRTYMKCNTQGYDEAYCCRQEHFYDAASGQCLRILDQSDPCNIETCPSNYKEECRFTAVPDNPAQFYDTDAGIIRDCAPSTTFAENICTCDGSSLIKVCKKEVWAKFDNHKDKWSVKNYGDGWISVFGDMTKNWTSQGVTYGTFDGSSGMEVWRYDHTALPEISMEVTFQPVASGNGRQVLISNCMSVDNSEPSFEVALNPATSTVDIIGKSKFNAAQLSLPYNNQDWNKLKLFFDGVNFIGALEDPAGVERPSVQAAVLRGEITAGVGALKFGPCVDSFSMPMKNGFTGFVSEVMFSKCLDTAGEDFIQDTLAGLGQ